MRGLAFFPLVALGVLLGGCAAGQKSTGDDTGSVGTPPLPIPTPDFATPMPDARPRIDLKRTAFAALPGWRRDAPGPALVAFQKSCVKLMSLPADHALGANATVPGGAVRNWQGPCAAAQALPDNAPDNVVNNAAAKRFFETWFVAYEVSDGGDPDGLFTGYYEPQLNGAWTRGGRYQTPLYARPDDLVSVSLGAFDNALGGNTLWGQVQGGKVQPYASRARIEAGSVRGLKPLLWVDDPVDAFFLHVQGSGQVRLPDGQVVRVGFAGKNGLDYKSIGRVLIDSGEIPANRLTMDAIRQWVAARPVAGAALLRKNPSFVFFRLIEGDGPIGAQGVALSAERSLAVDRRFMPLGAPVWLVTRDPLDGAKPFQRLMIAQDTGGAIRGVVRGDIFFGTGPKATKRAGNMKRPGRYFIFLPLSVVPVEAVRR